MRFWALFCLSIICVFTNCSGQTRGPDPAENKLTFIILGNDSIICYTGTSGYMQNIKRGLVSDTAFMNGMFRNISGKGATPVFKVSDDQDVLITGGHVLIQMRRHGLEVKPDTLDDNELKMFGSSIHPTVLPGFNGEPLRLPPMREGESP